MIQLFIYNAHLLTLIIFISVINFKISCKSLVATIVVGTSIATLGQFIPDRLGLEIFRIFLSALVEDFFRVYLLFYLYEKTGAIGSIFIAALSFSVIEYIPFLLQLYADSSDHYYKNTNEYLFENLRISAHLMICVSLFFLYLRNSKWIFAVIFLHGVHNMFIMLIYSGFIYIEYENKTNQTAFITSFFVVSLMIITSRFIYKEGLTISMLPLAWWKV